MPSSETLDTAGGWVCSKARSHFRLGTPRYVIVITIGGLLLTFKYFQVFIKARPILYVGNSPCLQG